MIIKETLHEGFTKYHLNSDGEEGWPLRPVLHRFTLPDVGYPHDHPFDIDVHVLIGSYIEEIYEIIDHMTWYITLVERKHGDRFIIPASRIHKMVRLPEGECWTCCEYGIKTRDTRFWRYEDGQIQSRTWGEEWK